MINRLPALCDRFRGTIEWNFTERKCAFMARIAHFGGVLFAYFEQRVKGSRLQISISGIKQDTLRIIFVLRLISMGLMTLSLSLA